MTSKDTLNADGVPVAASAYTDRTTKHSQIREGHLPDIDNLLEGSPFFANDIKKDRTVWCDSYLLSIEIEAQPDLRQLIQNLRDTSANSAHVAVEAWLRLRGHDDDADRMLVYLACTNDETARHRLIASSQRSSGWAHDDYDRLFVAATAIGLMYARRKSMDSFCEAGLKIIADDANAIARFNAARDAAVAVAGQADIEQMKRAVAAVARADAEIDHDIFEDRAEIVRWPSLERIVVPKLPDVASGHRKDLQRSWKGLDGEPLPIVARGDIAAHRRALVAAWPHAADLIDVVLGDLAAREEVRFRPTLFLGPAGSGKSSLARSICDQIGLPCELYNMAGMADSSLGGTSAQWSTAREAVPLQLVKRSKMASVCVIWDEVEKADDGKNNGSAMDALLPLLEVDQARRFRDLTLEVECDLSMVSHFATANSLEGIPAPLKDRMRILVMPEPTWQHLGTLTHQIVGRIAKDRGLDLRWYAPLAEDEVDLVKQAWPGGSIRQLTRILTTVIDGREQIMGRC